MSLPLPAVAMSLPSGWKATSAAAPQWNQRGAQGRRTEDELGVVPLDLRAQLRRLELADVVELQRAALSARNGDQQHLQRGRRAHQPSNKRGRDAYVGDVRVEAH